MYLLFDIGYTNMRFAFSADLQTMSEPEILDSPQDHDLALGVIKEMVGRLSQGQTIKGVYGGVTRKHQHLVAEIPKLFTCPVYVENDTALVGLGEATVGAGVGSKILAYLTISSGVGGVRIIEGKIGHATVGFEPGH